MRVSLLLVVALPLLTGCLLFGPPAVFTDPANFADEPWRHQGDRLDRRSLALLRRWGADYGMRPEEACDEQVVRETLRVVPLAPLDHGAGDRHDARTMILRRRPQAAYVALEAAMRDAAPRTRESAVWLFGDLDARRMVCIEPGQQPPWSGPERDVALGRLEALLGDPDPQVRYAAASELERGIGGPRRPSFETVLSAIEREQDDEAKDALLRLLGTREAPAADRLAAARLHATNWILASYLIEGLVVPENGRILEQEFRLAGRPLRVAILKEAQELHPPQPWLEGLVRLGVADLDEGVRLTAEDVRRSVVTPQP